MLDLFFRDAACLDLDTNTVRRCDVGVSNGIITLVREHQSDDLVPAKHTVACSGYWLFPGFLDIHTHLFAHGSTFGLDADRLLTAGVTYTVDMGSAGWVNYPAFRMCDLAGKRIGRSAFLNLSPVGQPGKGISEPLNEEVISQDEMAKIIEQFPGEISGIKVRISRNIVGQLGLSPLKRAIELGDHFGLPVCVHTTDPPANTGEIAGLLRPGDIYSHMYHGQGQSILREDGSVEPEIHRAQKRGVYLEVGNGKKNFDFRVAERAIADGLFPDLITSDSTPATFHKDRSMWDLPFVMSKFLALGMPLSQVLRSVTETPAKALGLDNKLGCIKKGYQADLVLCQIQEQEQALYDSFGNQRSGSRFIQPCMTILNGEVAYASSMAPGLDAIHI